MELPAVYEVTAVEARTSISLLTRDERIIGSESGIL
jgi:hypothetical protein